MARLLSSQTAAGPLAEAAGIVVEVFAFNQLLKQSRRVQGRMSAAGFFMDQQQAQCAGPKMA